jgi:hypothetical protein
VRPTTRMISKTRSSTTRSSISTRRRTTLGRRRRGSSCTWARWSSWKSKWKYIESVSTTHPRRSPVKPKARGTKKPRASGPAVVKPVRKSIWTIARELHRPKGEGSRRSPIKIDSDDEGVGGAGPSRTTPTPGRLLVGSPCDTADIHQVARLPMSLRLCGIRNHSIDRFTRTPRAILE